MHEIKWIEEFQNQNDVYEGDHIDVSVSAKTAVGWLEYMFQASVNGDSGWRYTLLPTDIAVVAPVYRRPWLLRLAFFDQ